MYSYSSREKPEECLRHVWRTSYRANDSWSPNKVFKINMTPNVHWWRKMSAAIKWATLLSFERWNPTRIIVHSNSQQSRSTPWSSDGKLVGSQPNYERQGLRSSVRKSPLLGAGNSILPPERYVGKNTDKGRSDNWLEDFKETLIWLTRGSEGNSNLEQDHASKQGDDGRAEG